MCRDTPRYSASRVCQSNLENLSTVVDLRERYSVDTLPEVDLVSLVEEQLPRYSLRADAVTDFTGYSNADWNIQTPCPSLGEDFSFSTEFIAETLKYFGNDEIYQFRYFYKYTCFEGSLCHYLRCSQNESCIAFHIFLPHVSK